MTISKTNNANISLSEKYASMSEEDNVSSKEGFSKNSFGHYKQVGWTFSSYSYPEFMERVKDSREGLDVPGENDASKANKANNAPGVSESSAALVNRLLSDLKSLAISQKPGESLKALSQSADQLRFHEDLLIREKNWGEKAPELYARGLPLVRNENIGQAILALENAAKNIRQGDLKEANEFLQTAIRYLLSSGTNGKISWTKPSVNISPPPVESALKKIPFSEDGEGMDIVKDALKDLVAVSMIDMDNLPVETEAYSEALQVNAETALTIRTHKETLETHFKKISKTGVPLLNRTIGEINANLHNSLVNIQTDCEEAMKLIEEAIRRLWGLRLLYVVENLKKIRALCVGNDAWKRGQCSDGIAKLLERQDTFGRKGMPATSFGSLVLELKRVEENLLLLMKTTQETSPLGQKMIQFKALLEREIAFFEDAFVKGCHVCLEPYVKKDANCKALSDERLRKLGYSEIGIVTSPDQSEDKGGKRVSGTSAIVEDIEKLLEQPGTEKRKEALENVLRVCKETEGLRARVSLQDGILDSREFGSRKERKKAFYQKKRELGRQFRESSFFDTFTKPAFSFLNAFGGAPLAPQERETEWVSYRTEIPREEILETDMQKALRLSREEQQEKEELQIALAISQSDQGGAPQGKEAQEEQVTQPDKDLQEGIRISLREDLEEEASRLSGIG